MLRGMAKVLRFDTHCSKQNAFIINSSAILCKALKYYAQIVIFFMKKKGEPIYFISDDTKRTGKHIEGAFKYYGHLSKTYVKGQQLIKVD